MRPVPTGRAQSGWDGPCVTLVHTPTQAGAAKAAATAGHHRAHCAVQVARTGFGMPPKSKRQRKQLSAQSLKVKQKSHAGHNQAALDLLSDELREELEG